MARQTIDKNSEAFKILQENISSARGREFDESATLKEIKGSERLYAIYKNIEKTLKETNKLYEKNRKTIDFINKSNEENFKNVKLDKITREAITAINRKNLKYLDDTQELTRESLRNDIDSKKIKEKIAEINKSINRTERERNVETDKYRKSFTELLDFVDKNSKSIKLPKTNIESIILQIEKAEDVYRNHLKDLNNSTDDATRDMYEILAEKAKSNQNKLLGKLFSSVEGKDSNGNIDDDISKRVKEEINTILGEVFQSSNIVSSLDLSNDVAKNDTQRLEEEKKRAEVLEAKIGRVGRIFDVLGNTPLNALVDFKSAKSKLSDAGGVGDSVGGSAMKHILGESGLGKLGVVGGGFMVMKEIIGLMFKADDRLTKIAKSFGIAKSEAGGIYDNMEGINTELAMIGINIDDIIDAQLKFNDSFSYSVNLTKQSLKDIGQATKLIGLSGEAVNELISQNLTTNKDVKEVEANILGNIIMQSGGLQNNKVMLEKVLKVSGEVRANFKGNIGEIAKAVSKAQELGISLEKVNSIGEGLLDFESSIASEMEAELLTGKDLYLEKARYYALTGETAKLMEEINKNVGNFDSFTNMNVLQQKAYANAIGMTREEMSNMLFEQQVNSKIIALGNREFTEDQRTFLSQSDKFKKDYNRIMNDGALSQKDKLDRLGEIAVTNLSQLSAQQKFEEALNKLKEKLAQIVGDGAILDKLSNSLIHFMGFFNIIDESSVRKYDADTLIRKTNPNIKTESEEYKKMINKYSTISPAKFENIVETFDIKYEENYKNNPATLNKIRKSLYQDALPNQDISMFNQAFINTLTKAIGNVNLNVQLDSTSVKTALNKPSGG
jgi:hypothetical protein